MSARALADAVRRGDVRARALAEAALARAEDLGRRYGAVVYVDGDAACRAADAVDAAVAAGRDPGPLAGVPVTVKDNIAVAAAPLSAGSAMLRGYISPFDATAVARLRQAGAVVVAKTNLDEFGMGSATASGVAGPARNPFDATRTCGGSSGGAAAAVALDIGALALGTDTGGSVRLPAAFCGVVGLKPTYGRVSRYGVVAYASSLDQVGVLASSVDDAAVALAIISGRCADDATCADLDAFADDADADLRGRRVGVVAGMADALAATSPALAARHAAGLAQLRDAGATLVDVTLDGLDAAVAAYYVLATAEASTNLARYDGVRYGHRARGDGLDLAGLISRSRAEGFGREVQRRILLGTFALSAGYQRAYYERAARVRRRVRDDLVAALAGVDALALPTAPTTAWPLDTPQRDPTALYAMDVYTVLANLAGLPALSLPLSQAPGELPAGLQLLGRAFDEASLLALARAFERERGPTPRPVVPPAEARG